MPQTAQVTCVNKTPRYDPHDRIQSLGGPAGGGWKLSQSEVIALIEKGEWNFYTANASGQGVWIVVAVSRYGHKYLKTEPDNEQPDNLLSLPECP